MEDLKILQEDCRSETAASASHEMLARVVGIIGIAEEFIGRIFSFNDDLEVRSESFDLRRDIIEPVLEELSPEIIHRQIEVDSCLGVVPANGIPIKGSKIWLKTVFRNLLRNAIKYGEQGGKIAFGCEDHGSFYQLNVSNSGNPIPEEYRSQLFRKFVCIKNDKNAAGNVQCLGLGLHLVKNIIVQHGGEIWYAAMKGGSNFVFTLPASHTP
jgi:signal transduction histidine kinase